MTSICLVVCERVVLMVRGRVVSRGFVGLQLMPPSSQTLSRDFEAFNASRIAWVQAQNVVQLVPPIMETPREWNAVAATLPLAPGVC